MVLLLFQQCCCICLAVMAYAGTVFWSNGPIIGILTVDFQSFSGLVYFEFLFSIYGDIHKKLYQD